MIAVAGSCRGSPPRYSGDRDAQAAREQVVRGEVDDRERSQPDAAAERGEIRALAAIEQRLDRVGPRNRRADVVMGDDAA